MTQGERVKEIRKSHNLTLEKFGERIGLKKNSLSQIENGKNSLTEQVIKSICREYNVNYLWLTQGIGDMYIQKDTRTALYEKIDQTLDSENEHVKQVFKNFANLDKSEYDTLISILDKLLSGEKPE